MADLSRRSYRFSLITICILQSLLHINAYGPFDIGICYGDFSSSLLHPPISDSMAFIKNLSITKVRFYHPYPDAMEALRGSDVSVAVGIRNEDLAPLARSADAAKLWMEQNIQPYAKDVVISYIVLGNNAVPGNVSKYILNAMVNLQGLINDDASIKAIKVTTEVDQNVLINSTYLVPSKSEFTKEASVYLLPIVKFLSMQSSPLMINFLADDIFIAHQQNYSTEFATFQTKLPVFYDHSLGYKNLFETMVDSFYWAMEKFGCGNVGVAITTGWSSWGRIPVGSNVNAYNYNYGMMQQVSLGGGTPKKPNGYLDAFIFEMLVERDYYGQIPSYGLFEYDLRPVYDLFTPPPPPPPPSPTPPY